MTTRPCRPFSLLPLSRYLLLCLPLWSMPADAAAQADGDAEALAHARGCMSCHGLVRKQVGPGFAQIAERYRGDATATDRLAARIRNGSVGDWGRVIMPRQTGVSEAQAKALAGWILSRRPQVDNQR